MVLDPPAEARTRRKATEKIRKNHNCFLPMIQTFSKPQSNRKKYIRCPYFRATRDMIRARLILMPLTCHYRPKYTQACMTLEVINQRRLCIKQIKNAERDLNYYR